MTGNELDELRAWLATEGGYQNVRVLEDGTIVGTLELLFTRALVIGLNRWGWERRYCYEDRILANAAVLLLDTGDDEPLPGYVAQRAGPMPRRTPGEHKKHPRNSF